MNLDKTEKSYKKSSRRHHFRLSMIDDEHFKRIVSLEDMVLTLAVPIGSFVNKGDNLFTSCNMFSWFNE